MGGYGSGRTSYRQKADHYRSLDVNKMHKAGALKPNALGGWQWTQDGEQIASINYGMSGAGLVLNYRVRQNEADWESVIETVGLTYEKCHHGGERPYFRCPGLINGVACHRRVVKLYLGGKYFLCRHCYNLAYTSQSEERYDRMLRRANKLRMALGGQPGTANWIARKPKGMWHRTYQRKVNEINWCEYHANLQFISKYRNVLSREELEMYFGPDAT